MLLQTKFDIGQEVWLVREECVKECRYCDGTGTIQLRGDDFNCPACEGKFPNLGHYKWIKVSSSATIEGIHLHDDGEITYNLKVANVWRGSIAEERLYATKEECQQAIDVASK